ncbi:2-hydroxyacid dehydrogenase [Granulosicoccus sp. 3-233]|uniref:2-hydroxyacid dehydrogenase n=1 Tax=Granulosicoccus sp. 3-233 TaxID=3417969 RepID=UPI003D341DA8
MSHTLLLIGPLLPSVVSTLESSYTLHRYWQSEDKDALLADIADDCVAVVTDGGSGVSADILKKLPRVKIVSVFGVGVDAVDLDYCRDHGINVSNTPDVLSDDVADMAMALALAVSRKLIVGDQYARAGKWPVSGAMSLSRRVMGKRAGIYGMGSIGKALAQRLEGFRMPISYCNRSPRSDSGHYTFVASLQELARQVDYLFVTAAATSGTIGSINATVLDALGPDGYLINVSRGTLVDESALLSSLQEKRIAGAGLDVFANEPIIPEAFFSLENVVLQPHNASGTRETREAMGKLVLDNLAAHFAGQPLLTAVT